MRRWLPTPAEVAAVFPERSAVERLALSAEAALGRALNGVLGRVVRRLGPAALAAHVRPVGAERLLALRAARRPVVLVAWHGGLPAVLPSGLVALGLEAMVLRHHDAADVDGITWAVTRDRQAAALQQAVRHLRAGGLVACALDPVVVPPEDAQASSFLGRAVLLQRGPAAMARLGGATLLCAAPRRRGLGLELALADPAIPPGDDDARTHALASWWAAWFRAHPGELWPESLRALAATP